MTRDLLLRTLASAATDAVGVERLKAALALGCDLNLPDQSGIRLPTVLGAGEPQSAAAP